MGSRVAPRLSELRNGSARGRAFLRERRRRARQLLRALLWRPAISTVVTTTAHLFAGVLPQWVIQRIPVVRQFDVPIPGTPRSFRVESKGFDMSTPVFWRGLEEWDPMTRRVLLHLARHSVTVFDVGANIGIATLLMAAGSPSTTVHAFEPVPRIFERLRRNVELNPSLTNVVVHQLGLWSAPGETLIHVPVGASVPTEASVWEREQESEAIPITLDSVDNVVKSRRIRRVDLIKIDTEGSERWVVEGALETLARDRPFVVCELLNSERWSPPEQRVEAYVGRVLFGLGYRAFHLRHTGAEPCSELRPDPEYRDLDFLFVPSERERDLPSWLSNSRDR